MAKKEAKAARAQAEAATLEAAEACVQASTAEETATAAQHEAAVAKHEASGLRREARYCQPNPGRRGPTCVPALTAAGPRCLSHGCGSVAFFLGSHHLLLRLVRV